MRPVGEAALVRRVGIDLRMVHYARAGFHRYAQGLIRSLERFPQEGQRFVLLHHADADPFETAAPHIETAPLVTPLFCSDEGERLGREIAPLALDVVHFPFSLFPGRVAGRVVLTLHDLTCVERSESIERAYLPFYLGALREAGRADLILGDSDRVAAELIAAGLPARKVRRCYPVTPFEEPVLAAEGGIDRGLVERLDGRAYLLCIGSLEPRKNHLALLAAFTCLRRRVAEPVLLVLAGGHGWLEEPFLDALAENPYRDDVWLVRDASDATLRHLLRHCRLHVSCSVYEGFGLPPLEALAEGACVVSTPVPSLLESGFPHDGFIETADPDRLAERLAALLADPAARDSLATRGRTAVGAFYRSCDPARLARLYAV